MNARDQWGNVSWNENFALLRKIGASKETARALYRRPWVALSRWAKLRLKKLRKKEGKE